MDKKRGIYLFVNGVRQARRLLVLVIGFTVLALGLIMIFLPGPAVVIIPLGLAILATEFVWAKVLLDKVKRKMARRKGNADGTQ